MGEVVQKKRDGQSKIEKLLKKIGDEFKHPPSICYDNWAERVGFDSLMACTYTSWAIIGHYCIASPGPKTGDDITLSVLGTLLGASYRPDWISLRICRRRHHGHSK